MAEALGLAASIVAVIQISASIISLTDGIIDSIKDAPRDMHLIRIEISALKAVFESLKVLAEAQTLSEQNVGPRTNVIEACEVSISKLEVLLKPAANASTSGSAFRLPLATLAWPLKKEKAKRLLDEISRYKTTLTLSISTESACVLWLRVERVLLEADSVHCLDKTSKPFASTS
jgi:hypothetical protein